MNSATDSSTYRNEKRVVEEWCQTNPNLGDEPVVRYSTLLHVPLLSFAVLSLEIKKNKPGKNSTFLQTSRDLQWLLQLAELLPTTAALSG